MNRGLLYQGMVESDLLHRVRELDMHQSDTTRQLLTTTFSRTREKTNTLWDAFTPPTHIWQGVSGSFTTALSLTGKPAEGTVFLLEEASRDPIVLEVPWEVVPAFVLKAWYPSDDVYICDPGMKWCFVLTSHDTIALYR